jgi:AraC-like DNA-binding protein
MDVLSTMLQTVKLEGALFFNGEFSAPWCVRTPDSCVLLPYLTPVERKHVIIFHYVLDGSGYAYIENGARLPLNAGDLLVFPHGDAHFMGNGRDVEARDHGSMVREIIAQGLKLARFGGGGEITKLVCGYLLCDPQLSLSFLSGLPAMFKVNVCASSSGEWLEDSIRYSVGRAADKQIGSEIVIAKLSEALFTETLRSYIEQLPAEQTGWLAGARDPEIGNALAMLHRAPGECWTVARLAKQVGVSRSVLAERFRHFLGVPPMTYITRWRMQLGAQMLRSTSRSVSQVASAVGYDSEPAFNRAFKREFGSPPARFRTKAKTAAAG